MDDDFDHISSDIYAGEEYSVYIKHEFDGSLPIKKVKYFVIQYKDFDRESDYDTNEIYIAIED